MKAYRVHKWGEALELENITKPIAKTGEVLIAVKAIGMNPVDYLIRYGYIFTHNLKLPVILGCEVSGVVEAVGEGVQEYKVGDRVCGLINFPDKEGTREGRGFAEYVTAPITDLAHIPQEVNFTEAGTLSAVGLTAFQALFETGNLKAGQRVLIHGAAGGVGHIAVQLAKAAGAYVVATSSQENMSFVKNLGADKVIDYKSEQFENKINNVDLVLNPIGEEIGLRSLQIIKSGGTLVSLMPLSNEVAALGKEKNIVSTYISVKANTNNLKYLLRKVADKIIQVHVDATYPFTELPKAQEALEKASIRGKLAVSLL